MFGFNRSNAEELTAEEARKVNERFNSFKNDEYYEDDMNKVLENEDPMRLEFENKVVTSLKENLEENLGKDYLSYFYNELYTPDFTLPDNISKQDAAQILTEYIKIVDAADDKDKWFDKIKSLCEPLGFTPNVKEYKKNPDAYKGHVGDVSTVIRIALTSRRNTPDLYSIMQLLGEDEIRARLSDALKSFEE